jgi:hypothetical protein
VFVAKTLLWRDNIVEISLLAIHSRGTVHNRIVKEFEEKGNVSDEREMECKRRTSARTEESVDVAITRSPQRRVQRLGCVSICATTHA